MLHWPTHERHAADLRFFFRDAAGAMGLRSNFGGMVASLEGGGFHPKPNHEVADHVLFAAERARRVLRVLEACPVWARVVLSIAYRHADGEQRLMGALTAASQEHRRSRTKRTLQDWLERMRKSKEPLRRKLYSDLRLNMLALLEEALESYTSAVGTLAAKRRRPQEAEA